MKTNRVMWIVGTALCASLLMSVPAQAGTTGGKARIPAAKRYRVTQIVDRDVVVAESPQATGWVAVSPANGFRAVTPELQRMFVRPVPVFERMFVRPVPVFERMFVRPVPAMERMFVRPVPVFERMFVRPVPAMERMFVRPVPTMERMFVRPVPTMERMFVRPVPTAD